MSHGTPETMMSLVSGLISVKKKVYTVDNAFKKNRKNIEKLNEQKYWVLCNIEPVLLSD